MLNSKKEWVEITPFGKVIASNGNPEEDDDITPPPEDNDNIIYDGGIL